MAGLMDELIATLEGELNIYKGLIPLADAKSSIIIKNDLQMLTDITDKEQLAVEQLNVLEKKRGEVMKNMCIVLNRKKGDMKLDELIGLMTKQPETQGRLREIKSALSETLGRLKTLNNRNEKLISESLEISEYHLNMIRSSRSYIGNNYTRRAGQFDMSSMMTSGSFDARN